MGLSPSRFFKIQDRILYKRLNNQFEHIYRDILLGKPHKLNGRLDTVIQWSREVEYPWAIMNSELKAGMRVADLGCGGSPLPYYLSHESKCSEVIAADPKLFGYWDNTQNGIWGYVKNPHYSWPEINWMQKDMKLVDSCNLDRVFCISVFEHMSIEDRGIALGNISRMLSDNGLFVMTMDVDASDPVSFVIDFMNAAKSRGLYVRGERDFNAPSADVKLGICHVCGIVLSKNR